ncbi:MAG TPA: regulatory protein RecX [Gammaproteobacteria bacterium]|nr:regulatory protein RecX [Gammaproteobacteria bacterium]
MRLLARREHSVRELRFKLAQRGHAADIIDRVLAGLIAAGFLSDRRFAGTFALSRFERGMGPARIRAELRERGIDEADIEAALASLGADWFVAVRRVREKRFGAAAANDVRERARQMRFLQRRGFDSAHIRAALDEYD